MYTLPKTRISREYLKADYERAGLPIYEVTYREWKKRFFPITEEDYERTRDFMGVYHNDASAATFNLPKRFIIINASMPNFEKLSTLWHEVGHHSCVRAGCLCARRVFVFRKTELHAELACLYIALIRRFDWMVLDLVKDVVTDLENKTFHYIKNATMMVKHPVFTQSLSLVKESFDGWINEPKNESLKKRFQNALVDTATRQCRWTPSNYLKRFAAKI